MRKRKLVLIIIIIILFVFLLFKSDMFKETKENMLNITKDLVEDIDSRDYEEIKTILKKEDGSELSDEEITNFLLNTGLYRIILVDEEEYNYKTSANFFDTKTGSILFSFKAADGQTIPNVINYVRKGIKEYLVAEDYKRINKEKEKYYIPSDLANGDKIRYEDNKTDKLIDYEIYNLSYEDNTFCLEILKEAKSDIIANINIILEEELSSLKKINNQYDINWNDDYSIFNIYYDNDAEQSRGNIMRLKIWYSAILLQAFNDKSDWHLTINYYDYKTSELLRTEIIR